jgi:hypothetical protein
MAITKHGVTYPKKYHSYYEIETDLDMTTSDAQGFAEANPELLADDFEY